MEAMKWKPLPHFEGVPALLVSPSFGANSYTLHLSDLAHTWTETLDRKGIVKRSLNEDTSIDPTEGADQMRILLTKLQSAFDPSSPDHSLVSLTLATVSDADSGSLVLIMTCDLPEGLRPLVWPFQLTKCPPGSIASQLVLPLIQAQHTRTREVEALISNLRDKDAVIAKLVEKLGAAGMGLENIFVPLATNRQVSKSTAENKVKGLAPFNEEEWRSSPIAYADGDMPGDASALLNVFFEPIHLPHTQINLSGDPDDWWAKIGSKPVAAALVIRDQQVSTSKVSKPQDKELSSDDDDFQIQATPPNLTSRRKGTIKIVDDTSTAADPIPDSHRPPLQPSVSHPGILRKQETTRTLSTSQSALRATGSDDETASESDVEISETRLQDGPSSKGRVYQRASPAGDATASESDVASETSSRLRNVGKNTIPPTPLASRSSRHITTACDDASKSNAQPSRLHPGEAFSPVGKTGKDKLTKSPSKSIYAASPQHRKDETATDSDGDDSSPAGSLISSKRPPTQHKRGLGRIGGAGRQSPSTRLGRADSDTDSESASSSKPTRGRIGLIGKRKVEEEQPGTRESDVIETDDQKAGRKRAELARELERKAAAPPTKKKRRF